MALRAWFVLALTCAAVVHQLRYNLTLLQAYAVAGGLCLRCLAVWACCWAEEKASRWEVVMTEQADLAVFDGGNVRLFSGFARWRAMEAALRSGRDLVIEQMLFDAGRPIRSGDPFAMFWRDEAVEMDWLEDFLCNPVVGEMMTTLQALEVKLKAPEQHEEEEEEEMLFTKSMLVTTGMDMADYS